MNHPVFWCCWFLEARSSPQSAPGLRWWKLNSAWRPITSVPRNFKLDPWQWDGYGWILVDEGWWGMMRMVLDMCKSVVCRHSLRRLAVEGCHQWRKSCADAVLLWGRGTVNVIALLLPHIVRSVVLEVCGILSYTMRYYAIQIGSSTAENVLTESDVT